MLVVKACVWREVEVVGVGDVASLFPAWAFVWGNVDPHGGGLGAGEPDGGAVVVEIRAPALLVRNLMNTRFLESTETVRLRLVTVA